MTNHRVLRSIANIAEATRPSVTWGIRWTQDPRTRWSPSSSARRSSIFTSCSQTDTSFPWTSGCSTRRLIPCPCTRTRSNQEKCGGKCTENSSRTNFTVFYFVSLRPFKKKIYTSIFCDNIVLNLIINFICSSVYFNFQIYAYIKWQSLEMQYKY